MPHPAQSNLYAVPKPLASRCLDDFLASRPKAEMDSPVTPLHYGEWLERAFGSSSLHAFQLLIRVNIGHALQKSWRLIGLVREFIVLM